MEAADRRAAALDRSRSWILVEALRRFLAPPSAPAPSVAEPRIRYRPGLGAQRSGQLTADFALSPEERVRMAEETALVAELRGRPPVRTRVVAFDRLEDYLEWKRLEALNP